MKFIQKGLSNNDVSPLTCDEISSQELVEVAFGVLKSTSMTVNKL